MASIRALHVTADAAEKTFIKLALVRNEFDEELRAAARACYAADQALNVAIDDLENAVIERTESRTTETYDALIGAPLRAHATDTEAANE